MFDRGRKGAPEQLQALGYHPVVRPSPALLSFEEPRVGEDLQVVTHRGLTQPKGFCQVADARLRPFRVRDQTQEAKAGGISHHSQRCSYLLRLVRAEGSPQHLGAALLGDDLDELHGDILTNVDASVNVSSSVDVKEVPAWTSAWMAAARRTAARRAAARYRGPPGSHRAATLYPMMEERMSALTEAMSVLPVEQR